MYNIYSTSPEIPEETQLDLFGMVFDCTEPVPDTTEHVALDPRDQCRSPTEVNCPDYTGCLERFDFTKAQIERAISLHNKSLEIAFTYKNT